jgi:hypothetical protein
VKQSLFGLGIKRKDVAVREREGGRDFVPHAPCLKKDNNDDTLTIKMI